MAGLGHLESFLDTVLTGIADVLEWQRAALSTGASDRQTHPTAPEAAGLTKRELDVLHDLPSMMTLGEIGTARGVSLNTVKTHVRSIYGKLDAQTRREVTSTARGLGLL